jgi:hypothetical protein
MNELSTFLAGLGLAAALTTGALRYLQPHLKSILTELCGTEERARFWTSFSNVTLFLTPLIFALRVHPQKGTTTALIYAMSDQLSLALLGLVMAVSIGGIVIGRFIPSKSADPLRQEQAASRAG